MSAFSTIETSSTHGVPVSVSLDVNAARPKVAEMALLALTHTLIEHRLYEVMFEQTRAVGQVFDSFSVRRLLTLSGLRSYGSVRRGCHGLVRKLSVEALEPDEMRGSSKYLVFAPREIFDRRRAAGMQPHVDFLKSRNGNQAFSALLTNVIGRADLSRREAQVVLCCAEGISNAEIGKRLKISERTVKSHLRQIFVKFGVRRRTELVSQILTQRKGRGRAPTSLLVYRS